MSPRTIGDGTRQILEAIRAGHRHGADIMEATAQGGGTVYKVLRRMEERGWVAGRWEDASVAERERRPRRRYYRVTSEGQSELARAAQREVKVRGELRAAATGRSR